MDTYTITFTNGNSTTFTVTNGNDGEKGDKGDKGDKGNTGNTGATGNGISTVAKTGTSGLVDTYTITFTNGNTTTFTVTNGADGTVPIVTSWESTLSDSKVPSEKLTKNALDGKQATLVSGTSIKTINNESLLGSGNITVAPQIDIQTSWGNPTSDSKVASEKLIKDSLDGKLDNTFGSSAVTIASDDNIVITDTSDSNKVKKVANLLASQVKDSTAHSNIGSSANDTQATINSDIDTALSNKVSKSSTSGLLKSDGSVDTNTYLTSSALTDYVQKNLVISPSADLDDITTTGFYYCSYDITGTNISNTPNNVQSAFCLLVEDLGTNISAKKKQTFTTTSDGKTWIRTKTGGGWQSWKQLITSSSTTGLVKNDGSIDTNTYITSSALNGKLDIAQTSYKGKNVVVDSNTGNITFENKPTIPTKLSDLTNDSNFIETSSTTGLLKNDGSVMASGTGSSNWAVGNHTHSAYVNPTKVTSWSSTPSDDNVASEKLIKNSLDGKLDNSNSSTTVTIASEDKILITDYSDSNKIKRADNILASQVKDGSAHSNIGSSANASQSTINTKIDTELANRLSVQQGSVNRNMNVVTDDLGNITFEAKATVENVNRKMDKFYFKSQDFITPSEWYFDYTYYDVIPTVNNRILNFTDVGNSLFIFNYNYQNKVEQSRHLLPTNYTLAFTVTSTNSNSEIHIGGIYSGGTLVNVLDGSSNCTIEIVCVDGVATVTNSDTQNSWTTDYGWYVDFIKFVEVVNLGTIAISNFGYAPYTSMELIPSKALIEDNELSNINTGMGATQSAINSAVNTALGNKQATLVSGTNLKTINNTSLLGSGNIDISGGGSGGSCVTDFYIDTNTDEWVIGTSACSQGEVVTSWSSTLADTKVPSEKLVKNYVDGLIGSAITYIVGSGS